MRCLPRLRLARLAHWVALLGAISLIVFAIIDLFVGNVIIAIIELVLSLVVWHFELPYVEARARPRALYTHYAVRGIFYLIIAIPCYFSAWLFIPAIILMISGILYIFAELRGERDKRMEKAKAANTGAAGISGASATVPKAANYPAGSSAMPAGAYAGAAPSAPTPPMYVNPYAGTAGSYAGHTRTATPITAPSVSLQVAPPPSSDNPYLSVYSATSSQPHASSAPVAVARRSSAYPEPV
jgi:hypothetical protein